MEKVSILGDVVPFCMVVLCTVVWLFSSRPSENIPAKTFLRKLNMYFEGFLFMVFSKDSKGLGPKKNPDPDEILGRETVVKRMIFIRHGESDWNDIFNKGINLSALIRFINSVVREFKFIISFDSIFLDSQLNIEGISQAKELWHYLEHFNESKATMKERDIVKILRGDTPEKSVIVSSNLRRAISTTTIALWPRIERTGEKVVILSSLQEISRNVDTKAVTPARTVPNLYRLVDHCGKPGQFNSENVYDISENHGNKKSSFYGIKRFKAFNEWVFKRNEEFIIVGGHSLWFRYFFQTYLPFKLEHVSKKLKIANSGVVAFNLHRAELADGSSRYRIDPDSIIVVYKGFSPK
eukprot:gene4410-8780_t